MDSPESQIMRPNAPPQQTQFIPQYSESLEDKSDDLEDPALGNIDNSNECDFLEDGKMAMQWGPKVEDLFNVLELNYYMCLARQGAMIVRRATDNQQATTIENEN